MVWRELNKTLKGLHNWKAAGVDGIPYEFLKTAWEDEERDDFNPEEPNSSLGKVLIKMVNLLLEFGIPADWNSCVAIPFHKKDDPKDMDNYRIIWLIRTVVKLATIIYKKRLDSELSRLNFLRKEQAGFRTMEEAVGQSAALYEILRRRVIKGKKTYLAFIDFRKAYDTVPHEALLRKLHLLGVSGKAMIFTKSRYRHVQLLLRTESGYSTRTIAVDLGTKQGCPESTTDFNIIINDILDCLDGIGVKVSGLRYKICGLLFADDLVIISPTRAKLRRGLAALDRWANLHEMEFGISKCAIMGIGQEAMDKVTSTNDSFTLGGRMIPVVTEYIYLGTLFTYDLDLDKMAGVRADKGRKALHSIRPLLATKDIPLRLRVNIFKATVIPVLSYGGELWGMNTCRCIKTQNILNEGLRVLLGVKRCSAIVSKDVLLEEFGIFSIHTITSAAKTRALCKYSTVQTVIADLVNNHQYVQAKSVLGSQEANVG